MEHFGRLRHQAHDVAETDLDKARVEMFACGVRQPTLAVCQQWLERQK